MSNKVTIIVGLPGSGKSYYGRRLALSRHCRFIDDVSKSYNTLQDIIDMLLQYKECVIADPQLCKEKARQAAQRAFDKFGIESEWVFFTNDPRKCRENAKLRGNIAEVGVDIDVFSRQYVIGEGKVLPVWQATTGAK